MVGEGRPPALPNHYPGTKAYRDAIGLLRRVNALLVQVGRESEFAEHVESVRARFKMKRNFIKLIDRAKWS